MASVLWCLLGLLCFSKFSCILPVLSLLLGERLCLLLGEGLCLLLGSGLWRGPLSGSADLPANVKLKKRNYSTHFTWAVCSLWKTSFWAVMSWAMRSFWAVMPGAMMPGAMMPWAVVSRAMVSWA